MRFSMQLRADMPLYQRLCAYIFPIRIVYSDLILNSIITSIHFFRIFGYVYKLHTVCGYWMRFHANMRLSMRINRNAYAIMKKNAWPTLMEVCMYKPAWAVSIISLHLYIPATSNPPTESLMKESTSAADGGNHRERVLGDYFLAYHPAPFLFLPN